MSKTKLMVGDRVRIPAGYGKVHEIRGDKVIVEVDYMYLVTCKKSEVHKV